MIGVEDPRARVVEIWDVAKAYEGYMSPSSLPTELFVMKSIPNSGFSASRVLALIGVRTAFDGSQGLISEGGA